MIRFLVFSDLHYDDVEDVYNRIDKILANARNRKVDFMVSLGDLCKPVATNRKVLEKFSSLGIPFYPVIGNHETDEADLSAITEFYSLNSPYYSVVYGSYKLIFLNTCYLMENGTEKSYYKRNFKHSSSVYPIVPMDEIRWLQDELNDEKNA